MFGKFTSAIFGGSLVAILGTLLIGITLREGIEEIAATMVTSFVVIWVLAVVIVCSGPNAGIAWRRQFLVASIGSFCVPLVASRFPESAIVRLLQETEVALVIATGSERAINAVKSVPGGSGLLFGLLLLVMGLCVGRAKPSVVSDEPSPAPPKGRFENWLTVQDGTLTYRIIAPHRLTFEEMKKEVWEALETQKIQEPPFGGTTTLILDEEAKPANDVPVVLDDE